jgi:DNA (cytosine-5)-methyltransferase 1
VKNILYHDGGKTFNIILETFKSLGYKVAYKVLNAIDYGIPQVRNRVFVVGFKDHNINYNYPDPKPLNLTVQDLLEEKADSKYFLNQGFLDNYVFVQWGTWNRHPKVDKPIASTLTTKMGTLRATQDNYQTQDGRIRKLTPREGLRLMGFGDDFNIVCSDTQTYKQVGNSIVVDVIGAVLEKMIKELQV